jgi:hypothetical protein
MIRINRTIDSNVRLGLAASVVAGIALLEPGMSARASGHEKASRTSAESIQTDETTGRKDWNANIELTGTTNGVATHIRVKAHDVTLDYATGEVAVRPGGYVNVLERRGSVKRSFRMTESKKSYQGTFDADEQATWLSGILREQTSLPENVIEFLAR